MLKLVLAAGALCVLPVSLTPAAQAAPAAAPPAGVVTDAPSDRRCTWHTWSGRKCRTCTQRRQYPMGSCQRDHPGMRRWAPGRHPTTGVTAARH